MSNPSPQLPAARADASNAGAQSQAESLEHQLESMDLNDPQSKTALSEEPRTVKRSARSLLERLKRRRLEVTRIHFTSDGLQAGARGSHGEVVVATLTPVDGTSPESANQVAVKKFAFSDDINEERFLRTFANELHVLDGLDHPNIIRLVGFVEDMAKRRAWLVFPWEANGNVREFLLSGKWELPERASLIKDVASGLEYLHTRQPPVRHGDLKSLNILVNSNHRAVITDFGSARVQTEARGFETTSGSRGHQTASTGSNFTEDDTQCPEVTVTVTNAQLTLTGPSWSFRWAAPEILNEEEPCLASDIWALGWIAWEIVTDNYPFPEVRTNKLITVKVIKGLLPSLYDDGQLSQIGQLCDVMARCWKPEPKERLSAVECRTTLQWVPSTIPRTRNDGPLRIRSAALLLQMGEINRLRSRYKEALGLFEEAIGIARSAGEQGTMARALYLNGDCHRILNDYDQAEKACNESLAIFTSIGNSHGRANALLRLGEVHQSRGHLSKAHELFTDALAAYPRVESSLGQASALLKLGEIYRAQSNYAQADESFSQSLALFTRAGNSRGAAIVLSGLGDIHRLQSNHLRAEEYFNQALAIHTSIGNSSGQANALDGLGETQQARSNYPGAEESFKQALAIYTEVGDMVGRTNSLVGLGQALLHQARYSEAKSFLHDAVELSNGIDYKWGQDSSRRLLAEVLESEKSSTNTPP